MIDFREHDHREHAHTRARDAVEASISTRSRETINLFDWDAEERRYEADERAFAEADKRMRGRA